MATNKIIGMTADVAIKAEQGENSGPPSFEVVAYTGGALQLGGWDHSLVVDLSGMGFGNSLVANLDHDGSKRVGNITSKEIADGRLVLGGRASASTEARREVVESAKDGFVWQASIEASADRVEFVDAGDNVTVNGQEFAGPVYVARKTTLKGFAFVSHGADDNTEVAIAASDSGKMGEVSMDPQLKQWIEGMGFDADSLSDKQLASLKANYEGQQAPKEKPIKAELSGFEAIKAENERKASINRYAMQVCERDPDNFDAIRAMAEQAITEKWDLDKFKLAYLEASAPSPSPFAIHETTKSRVNNKVVEAAICQAGGLRDLEQKFDERTLDAAHEEFKGRISLQEVFIECAKANGYSGRGLTPEAQNYAMGYQGKKISAAGGFSTLALPNILSNSANKFLDDGWNTVDLTCLEISRTRSVRDFKTVTTVSLIGGATFEKLGPAGEIKHGEPSETSYTNKADTYARMLAITRQDLINDDLGAMTELPRELGRGAADSLNDIFWTKFLDNSTFFTSGRNNLNEGVATTTLAGLSATEVIFMNQTKPDGTPLNLMPAIMVVPPTQYSNALNIFSSPFVIDGTATATQGNVNVWQGKYRVFTSPYMENSSYTGYSTAYWYLLADPMRAPVIEIVALNGAVQPTVESADADFNVLGVQMRGYSDVGVEFYEYRYGVKADGGAS